MSRPPRIAYPHAIYHVLNRFVDRHPFFREPADYRVFIESFQETARPLGIRTYAWCVMPNHFHVVLETPQPCISKFLQRFLTRAARTLNRRHQRVGHLFQDRSKTLLVEDGSYFETVVAYVLMNPVRAGLVRGALDYEWSSAAATSRDAESGVDRMGLVSRLTGNNYSPTNVQEQMEDFLQWLRSIQFNENERVFREGHRGSFLGASKFRRRILRQEERRLRFAETRKRRSTDRDFAEVSWTDFVEATSRFVNHDARHWKYDWATPGFAARDLAVYLAHVWGGWRYDKIQEAEGDRAPLGSYRKVVSKIRRRATRRSILAKLEVRFAEVQRGQGREVAV